ncbi:hypothetical protein NEOLEDRAFT_1176049 [Neolentinus lepideus HHB14362 ss-1]|uniref:Uncharacterized protein n=1 Tax=Neolentinus lepideus HHB14362 ss-1 TaxID=1314782 RepID=A0A165UKR0_9AGAM|nr:hypothetical protein NEOLEDRAFT_1176049 [Neolentinus lepideus HHB14362 ss-1]
MRPPSVPMRPPSAPTRPPSAPTRPPSHRPEYCLAPVRELSYMPPEVSDHESPGIIAEESVAKEGMDLDLFDGAEGNDEDMFEAADEGDRDESEHSDASDDVLEHPTPNVASRRGRYTLEAATKIAEATAKIRQIAKDVAHDTGVNVDFILQGVRPGKRSKQHPWDIYQNYWKMVEHPGEPWNIKKVSADFNAFKQTHGKTYERILHTHNSVFQLDKAITTKAGRRGEWNKKWKEMTEQFDSLAEYQSFHGVIMMVGGNGMVDSYSTTTGLHETSAAKGFFEVKCYMPGTSVLQHLRAHVQNNESNREVILNRESTRGTQASEEAQATWQVVQHTPGDKDSLSTTARENIKVLFAYHGIPLRGDKNNRLSMFPWKTAVEGLRKEKKILVGWPWGVPLPTMSASDCGFGSLEYALQEKIAMALEK